MDETSRNPPPLDPARLELDDLSELSIREDVAREALSQVTLFFNEISETRKAYESKAQSLFSGYITVAAGLFGAVAFLVVEPQSGLPFWPFLFAGVLVALGAIAFTLTLLDSKYGYLGSHPDTWLRRGTIDGSAEVIGKTLAYLVEYQRERIAISMRANRWKRIWVRTGIWLGAAAPLALAVTLWAAIHPSEYVPANPAEEEAAAVVVAGEAAAVVAGEAGEAAVVAGEAAAGEATTSESLKKEAR